MYTFSSPCTNHEGCPLDLAKLRAAIKAAGSDRKRMTLLCSVRAHHRGRLHVRRMRQPDGSIREMSLEDQANRIASFVI